MAVNFHPLPLDSFPVEARPAVQRLNLELRDLFGLEGAINEPLRPRRSDRSVARRGTRQVHVTRIFPEITTSVAGDISLKRVNNLGTAPSDVVFKVLAGPPDRLFVSMHITGGSWDWIPIVKAP